MSGNSDLTGPRWKTRLLSSHDFFAITVRPMIAHSRAWPLTRSRPQPFLLALHSAHQSQSIGTVLSLNSKSRLASCALPPLHWWQCHFSPRYRSPLTGWFVLACTEFFSSSQMYFCMSSNMAFTVRVRAFFSDCSRAELKWLRLCLCCVFSPTHPLSLPLSLSPSRMFCLLFLDLAKLSQLRAFAYFLLSPWCSSLQILPVWILVEASPLHSSLQTP